MKLLYIFISLLWVTSISYSQEQQFIDNHKGIHKVVVINVLQATSYTYLHVKEKNDTVWLAIPKLNAEIGETYLYQGGNEMRDFKSTQLKRTFKSILFLGGVVKFEEDEVEKSTVKVNTSRNDVSVSPAGDGITIAELFSNKSDFEGKIVRIKGEVVQFSGSIMNRNWIHLQDGTEFQGDFDLIATTNMDVSVGDIVVLEGEISLDKDFGYGYFYKVIMENTKVIK